MRKIRFYLPAFGLAAAMAGALCIPAEETPEEIAAQVSLDEITAAVTDAAAPSEEPVPGMADLLGDVKRELGAEGTQNDSEKAYVALREIQVYDYPDENGTVAGKLSFETKVEASASGKEGWSEITANSQDGERIHGYVTDSSLSLESNIDPMLEYMTVSADSEVLDYPGQRDGDVIGEVLEYDEVEMTGVIGDTWSRIRFLDDNFEEQEGYILIDNLDGGGALIENLTGAGPDHTEENAQAAADADAVDAGYIHVSDGDGIFAIAEDNINVGGAQEINGVMIGEPVAVGEGATLIPLGTFRITHYCPCSICNGPYINGVTSTGALATTNHTIAVDPTQIPYGSKVVINGQVYVAEDCGGGIKHNCIDIYVATHEEGDAKGVYYTDVYLLQE